MQKPLLALTMGDPAGIGPEVIVGSWSAAEIHRRCRPLVVGHPEIFRRAVLLRGSDAEVVQIAAPEQAEPSPVVIPCLASGTSDALEAAPCTVDARSGQAAYDALMLAAKLALSGQVDGITTAPLNKAALWQAGHRYPGHTELLAECCGVDEFAMMLYLGPDQLPRCPAGLGVIHVTLHTALRNVFEMLTPRAVLSKIRLADKALGELKGSRPRIGVCALNPHSGEKGLFGSEERSIISPAVEQAQGEGLNARGPYPADTLLAEARDGQFDAVVAMYHDQGHIALKLLDRHSAVNVTLGLPIVRTSVAHGTAFDLAWQGRAETGSMIEAVRLAARLASARRAAREAGSKPGVVKA